MINVKNWEKYHQKKRGGSYPNIDIVRFIAKNYYSLKRRNIKILDLGCGNGAQTYFLAKENFSTYAIDFSNAAVMNTKSMMKENGLSVKALNGDISILPFSGNNFDAVVSNLTIYANELLKIKQIFSEIYRVLKPGGKVFIREYADLSGCIEVTKDKNNNRYDIKGAGFEETGLAHFFQKNELDKLFFERGFKILKSDWCE